MTFKYYNYISAFLAFFLWGFWAYYVNIESPNNLISAVAQGTASSIITLIMIKLIKFFYNVFPKSRLYFVLPSIITVGITSSFVVYMHILVNTKNIFYTVFPTIVIAFLFALYTTVKISRYIVQEERLNV